MDINSLEQKIISASKKYYTNGTSDITDSEFDRLVSELRTLDPSNPILTAVGWGYKPEKGIKHHFIKITGIDDKRKIELGDIVNDGYCFYAPKLDGCSVVNYYKNGNYFGSISRGDGEVGIDVTHNVYNKIPQQISNLTGFVRCEAAITYSNFEKYFPVTSSIRNSATGLITAQEPKPVLEYVDLVPVSVYDADKDKQIFIGNTEFNIYVREFKVKVGSLFSENQMGLTREHLDNIRKDYPVDGFVCYKDDDLLCAYKFDTEFKNVKIKYIESNTQFTGRIFPRIIIEETFISDCYVNKVSGKSCDAIISNRLGEGAIIEIVRSGEVVPNWTNKVITEADVVWTPKCSYGCDDKFLTADGAHYFCTNPNCPSIYGGVAEKLIKNFSPKSFSDDMLEILLTSYSNWYTKIYENINILSCVLKGISTQNFNICEYSVLTTHQEELINKTINKMYEKKMTIYELVSVCSIDGFGNTLSKQFETTLSGKDNINAILKSKKELSVEECNNSKARESWKNRHNIICDILSVFEIQIPKETVVENKGTVCITGSLSSCTKKEFNSIIESKGYVQVDSVNKNTNILICNKAGSSKAIKAEKLGITIVSENDFINNY
jgi:DNA ligase (NAD+)